MSALETLDILLADDNPNMRSIVMAMLKSLGLKRLREVEDGASALEALRQQPADIAIVDFKMLPLDGVTFTRLLRNAPDSPNPFLPIIMMTGHSELRRVVEARDAGVTEFITKPVTSMALMTRIEAIILKPRSFIRTETYFGPDRRRRRSHTYEGPYRRSDDLRAS